MIGHSARVSRVLSIVISFFVFLLAILVLTPTPTYALSWAAWTTQADFETNASTTGQPTTRSNIFFNGSNGMMVTPGATLGTIGGPLQSDVGLRVDAGVGKKAGWVSLIRFIALLNQPLGSGRAMKYAFKISDDGFVWSPPLGYDGAPIDWTSVTGNYFGEAYEGDGRQQNLGIPASRFVDVVVHVECNGNDSPGLGMLQLPYKYLVTYPNGLCIRNINSASVYLLENGARRAFTSATAFESNGYHWDDIVMVDPWDILNYPLGDPLYARAGTLIKGSGPGVYLTDYAGSAPVARPIRRAEDFMTLRLSWDNLKVISDSELSSYGLGVPMDTPGYPYNGRLFRFQGRSIYCVEKGLYRLISTWNAFYSYGWSTDMIDWGPPYDPNVRYPAYVPSPGGPVLYARAGTLLKGSGPAVYIVDEVTGVYYRRPISSAAVFNNLSLHWDDIRTVPDWELGCYREAALVE